MAAEEERCPNCGALVVKGADWCGQCYTPLNASPEPELETDPPSAPRTTPDGEGQVPPLPSLPPDLESAAVSGAATIDPLVQPAGAGETLERSEAEATTWTCPSCDHHNPLDLEICAVCGTPFSRLFDESPGAKHVDPERAARASIIPGLGHWICGLRGEAVTRGFFVAWGLGVGFLALFAKTSAQYPGGAKLHPVGALYIISALVVYGIGFVDAHRAARGHEQYLSVKILLYWFAALIFVFLISVFAAFLSVTKERITPGGGGPSVPTG